MSNEQEIVDGAETDPVVRLTYRNCATEAVPEQLDRVLLAEARHAAGVAAGYSWFSGTGWRIPVTLAAAAVLSLAVVLEFNRPVIPREADTTDRTGDSVALPDATGDLATAVESTGRKLRDLDRAAGDLIAGSQPGSAAGTAIDPTGSNVAGTEPADRSCAVEHTASAETWWSCIEALQHDGRFDEARAEIEFFSTVFPDFMPAR